MESKPKEAKTLYTRRVFLATTALAAAGAACSHLWPPSSLLRIFHAPRRFTRRAGDFTANVCGAFASVVSGARYRLNDGLWQELRQSPPRVPPPFFTIELEAGALRPATNRLEIEATAFGHKTETRLLQFDYDPAPITLPLNVDWSSHELDVQDGHWETFTVKGERRVRPIPGSENYDRLIAVCGAFSGGRRIETSFIFRHNAFDDRPFGFGVLPLWGGRPDDPGVSPRRGWNFSLAWYYSHYNGVGVEFSYKYGDAPPKWVSSYRDLKLVPGRRYFLAVECWPELDVAGRHRCHRQRMKWWAAGEPAPDEWIEVIDTVGSPIPPREYGVALVAHRSQVEFGPVVVTPLQKIQHVASI
jgi:hypothetical protein